MTTTQRGGRPPVSGTVDTDSRTDEDMNAAPLGANRTVILDTDIGSDVDDAMALAQILGTPNLTLDRVTTVYGDTNLRAQIAHRYGRLAGVDLSVHAGEWQPLSGREVWWAGHEGSLHVNLGRETVARTPAVEQLVASFRERPGELDLVAIGPLTNIATALAREPDFGTWIRHLWVMGGSFDGSDEPEHNFRSDDCAASAVLSAGIPTTITALEVTRQLTFQADDLDRIGAAGGLGRALRADIHQWWEYWQETWNVPHDPVAVLTLSDPHMFTFSAPGRVEIEVGGQDAGVSTFKPHEHGTIRLATAVDGQSATAAITRAIAAAAAEGTPFPSPGLSAARPGRER